MAVLVLRLDPFEFAFGPGPVHSLGFFLSIGDDVIACPLLIARMGDLMDHVEERAPIGFALLARDLELLAIGLIARPFGRRPLARIGRCGRLCVGYPVVRMAAA